jgi:hypothetical protein
MQNEDEQLKTTGEGRKLPGAGKHGCGRQRWWKAAVTAAAFSFLLSSPLFLFSVFRCSLSLFCSSSSSSVLLALAALMVAGWRWQLLGSPMTAAVLLLHGAATLTSVSSSSGLSFPRQLFSSPLLLPFLPLFFRASFSFFFPV